MILLRQPTCWPAATFRIDRAVHESIELRVRAVAPNGRPIDNPLLGRTPEDRSRGLWPKEPDRGRFARSASSLLHPPALRLRRGRRGSRHLHSRGDCLQQMVAAAELPRGAGNRQPGGRSRPKANSQGRSRRRSSARLSAPQRLQPQASRAKMPATADGRPSAIFPTARHGG